MKTMPAFHFLLPRLIKKYNATGKLLIYNTNYYRPEEGNELGGQYFLRRGVYSTRPLRIPLKDDMKLDFHAP